jgi:hypothetical protein
MSGGVTPQELEEALKTRLSASHTQINDISGIVLTITNKGGCGQSYEVVIVSPCKNTYTGVTGLYKENDARTPSTRQHSPQRGNLPPPRIFTEIIYSRRMGSSTNEIGIVATGRAY